MKDKYTIGTRGSLLALTQCDLIKEEIEEKSGLKFNLNVIKTQGDQITDKPLWQLEGKDFFTKELDHALINETIDLVVHSYKDLGSERPKDIKLRTITKRTYAHDILLIKKSTLEDLKSKKTFVVGTSSPRRIHNITKSFNQNIPYKDIEIKCETLRGNINSRIEKLRDNKYDAIVLALAGLERLAYKENSLKILKELTKDLTFMVLPQKTFPSSASQGALAIESHENASQELVSALALVHDKESAQVIEKERFAFNAYGGGCHLAVGVHVKKVYDYFVHIHKGISDDNEIDKIELEGLDTSSLIGKSIYNVIRENDFLIKKRHIAEKKSAKMNLFITSKHCLDNIQDYESIWTSGQITREKALEKGFWVNGCADGFGHQEIKNLKDSKVIQLLLRNDSWQVLSHNEASSNIGEVLGCYTHEIQAINPEREAEMKESDIIFWNSFTQYKLYTQHFPEIKGKRHACGLGKTLDQFKKRNINVIPALSFENLAKRLKRNE